MQARVLVYLLLGFFAGPSFAETYSLNLSDLTSVEVESRRQAGVTSLATSLSVFGSFTASNEAGDPLVIDGSRTRVENSQVTINFGVIATQHLRIPFESCLSLAKTAQTEGLIFSVSLKAVGVEAMKEMVSTVGSRTTAAVNILGRAGTSISCKLVKPIQANLGDKEDSVE